MKLSPREQRAARRTLADREAAHKARHPRLAQPTPASASRLDLTLLGVDDARRPVFVDTRTRCEHMHAIGATGSGKTTFLLNCILQDIACGRGVAVLDPHGGHPDSLLNTGLRFLRDHGWLGARQVHILSPNVREFVVGLNPLAPLPGTDVSVIADAMLKAFERAWGDEDTHQKPTTRSLLKAIFMALIELGMNLPDARLLLDHKDRSGVRARVLSKLKNEYAHAELDSLHQLSLETRSGESFRANIIGPVNRLNEFTSSEALRLMLGMNSERAKPDNTIDLLHIINRGHILLVDLQHGQAVSESDTDLLGKILLRYLFLLMAHRKPYRLDDGIPKFHPFFVYVDECHRYMTEDIEGLLAEARKYGIGVALAHQYLAQLGKPGEKIYEAVRNSTHIKTVFRINSAEEAQALALDVIPLDMELPVQASIRPVQVGHSIDWLQQQSDSVNEDTSTNLAETISDAIAHGRTEMQHWARVVSEGEVHSRARISGWHRDNVESSSQALNAQTTLSYDPQTGMLTPTNMGVGRGITTGSGAARIGGGSGADMTGYARIFSTSDMQGGATGVSEIKSKSHARQTGRGQRRGSGSTRGSAQAVLPVYETRANAWHSRDKAEYMAGETIRALPTGRAVVRFHHRTQFLNVPPPRKSKSP